MIPIIYEENRDCKKASKTRHQSLEVAFRGSSYRCPLGSGLKVATWMIQ